MSTYWHRAARALRAYIRDVEENESGLSDDVLALGKENMHLEMVLEDHRDALQQANALISAMEQDREIDRLEAYKRAKSHMEQRGHEVSGESQPSGLPVLDAAGPDLRTKWFRSRNDALSYAANNGFQQAPALRRVWLDLAWREEWSLRVPMPSEAA